MAKKPNYDFEKRRKEQDRKKKKDAKREERLSRKREPSSIQVDADGNVVEIFDDAEDEVASDETEPRAEPG